MRVTAILASHNRRDLTLACLTSYYGQLAPDESEIDAVLVDAGSTDGTPESVAERFPSTEVIRGDADLYWAGGMAVAERAALAREPDHLLWLNDDVVLDPTALGVLISITEREPGGRIAVGALRDPESGELTYSGVRRSGFHPLRMRLVAPAGSPLEVETFNGNVVLVPRPVRERVGPLDGGLVHSAADHDYGLRAGAAGVKNILTPTAIGVCARDGDRSPWLDRSIPIGERLKLLLGPKGIPPRPRARYLRRHGGWIWPVFWLWPYLRTAPLLIRPRSPQAVARRRP